MVKYFFDQCNYKKGDYDYEHALYVNLILV